MRSCLSELCKNINVYAYEVGSKRKFYLKVVCYDVDLLLIETLRDIIIKFWQRFLALQHFKEIDRNNFKLNSWLLGMGFFSFGTHILAR